TRTPDAEKKETYAIFIGRDRQMAVREASVIATDRARDLAVLRIAGAPLPTLKLGDSDRAREGWQLYFTGYPIGSVLGPVLLFRALAAAVIAKMENLWVAFGAAVAIGVVEEAVFFDAQRTSAVPPVLFAIVLVALVAQSRGTVSRAVDKAQSTWSAVREVRPIPPELAGVA
ncbi:MAG: trypsin-like peptidase domain-containing protein, partial [Acidimicrobiia bacterium]